jgi:hypothetical protein
MGVSPQPDREHRPKWVGTQCNDARKVRVSST